MSLFPDSDNYRRSLDRQREVADQLAYRWELDLIGTHEAAPVDLILTRDRIAVALVEIKTRNGGLAGFQHWANVAQPGYKVDWPKVRDGALGAVGIHVPYRFVVGCYDGRGQLEAVRWWELYNPQKARSQWAIEFRRDWSWGPKSNDNGDTRTEENLFAFLPIEQSLDLDRHGNVTRD